MPTPWSQSRSIPQRLHRQNDLPVGEADTDPCSISPAVEQYRPVDPAGVKERYSMQDAIDEDVMAWSSYD